MKIKHKYDLNSLGSRDFITKRIQTALKILETNPDINLTPLLRYYNSLARIAILIERSKDNLINDLRNNLFFSIINYKRNFGEVKFNYNQKNLVLNNFEKVSTRLSYDVFMMLNLGLIINDRLLIKEVLSLETYNNLNPYWNSSLNFLKGIIAQNDEIIEVEYQNILDYTEKGTSVFFGLNEIKKIESKEVSELHKSTRTPIIELYYSAYHGNQKNFNKELEEFTINKRNYLGKYKKLKDRSFWIDFNGLAVCNYAINKGIKLEYQSKYIPYWII